ncbi:hypothetical protein LPJ81_003842 [Coemansia sp. IMI 209127]|nr:hypothetical protein LPJ81_003842 [Coemansia sp. IMI 209127]
MSKNGIQEARNLVLKNTHKRSDSVVKIERLAQQTLDEVVDGIDETAAAIDSRTGKKTIDSTEDILDELLDAIDSGRETKLVEKGSKG